MSAGHLALRLQSVEQATKDALRKEYDEKHEQHAVDEIVPADRLGAKADAQGLGQHNRDDGPKVGPSETNRPPTMAANTICSDTAMPLTVSGVMNIWYWQ